MIYSEHFLIRLSLTRPEGAVGAENSFDRNLTGYF
jgi:hypothetical protein